MDRRPALALLTLLFILPSALAADPGHPATSIGPGTFEPGNISVQGNFSVGGGGTLRLFVDNSSGNVGIGTTGPGAPLHVSGSNTNWQTDQFRVESTSATGQLPMSFVISGTTRAKFRADYEGNINWVANGGQHRFYASTGDASSTWDMTIATSGNVGIGTTNPVSRLQVEGGNLTVNGNFTVGSPNNWTFFVNNASRTVGIGGLSNISRLTIAGGGLSDGGWTSSLRIAPFSGEDFPSIYFGSQNNTEYSAIIWSNNTAGAVRCDNCRLAQVALTPANDTSADLTFSTNPDAGRSAPAARMTIKSSGNVGIGTTSPASLLELKSGGRQALDIKDGNATINGNFSVGGGGTLWLFVNNDSGNGSVGINTTNPTARLTVSGGGPLLNVTDAKGTSTYLYVNGTTGNVGIGTAGPSTPLHINAADGGATVNLITYGLGGAGSSSNIVSRLATFGGGANNRLASWTVNYDDLAGAKDVTTYGALAIQLGPGTDDTNNGLAFQTAAAGTATTSTAMFISQGGNVGIGTTSPGGKVEVSSSATATSDIRVSNSGASQSFGLVKASRSGGGGNFGMAIENTNGDAFGDMLTFYKNSASPAASDILGYINFRGNDSGGAQQEYGYMLMRSADVTAGSEDGDYYFYTTTGGTTDTLAMYIGSTGSTLIAKKRFIYPTGGSLGTSNTGQDDYVFSIPSGNNGYYAEIMLQGLHGGSATQMTSKKFIAQGWLNANTLYSNSQTNDYGLGFSAAAITMTVSAIGNNNLVNFSFKNSDASNVYNYVIMFDMLGYTNNDIAFSQDYLT
ncbi:hypothetical protein HYY74_00090 [Candidatus Woesearchaeota archaeon]|nr:hypothetical protein [Candidatus Woesearchaeota archaeon]